MFCVTENALKTGNFAHKTEAYAKRKNEGAALPQKEQFGPVGASSDNGTDNLQSHNGSVRSKLSCNPKLWNVCESRLNGKSREAVTTNAKLEQLPLSVQLAYQTLCDRGAEFSAEDIKEQFQGSMQNRTTFLQRYENGGRREAIGWCGDYGTLALDVLHAPKASAGLYTRAIPYR